MTSVKETEGIYTVERQKNLNGVNGSGSSFFENQNVSKWLSTEEAAEYLSLSANALRIMVHRGQVQAFKLGRRLRFRLKDCQFLIRKEGV
jgi:excisionase family DNA binding protein